MMGKRVGMRENRDRNDGNTGTGMTEKREEEKPQETDPKRSVS